MIASVNGARLFYERHGRGDPMVVMHGGLGWDHSYLRPWLDDLGGAAELVYYDHRGNGRSERPSSWEHVDHATWVDDAEALRRELGLERFVLFGHSYGGFLAMEYALRYPERLCGLVLCCTAPALDYFPHSLALAQARATPEQYETLVAAFSAPLADDSALERSMEAILPIYFHQTSRARGFFRGVVYSAAASNHAFGRCTPSYDLRPRLLEITLPTLVLAGAHDWIMPPEYTAERIHTGVADSRLVTFEESGHFPFAEEPGEFRSVVLEWLQGVRS